MPRSPLALCALLAACSSSGAPETPRTLAIDATATLHVPPDCAAITLTFTSEDADLGLAHDAVEQHRAAFLEAIAPYDAEVQAGTIAYHPYRHDGGPERYRASQTVVVQTRHFDDIPGIIRRGTGLSNVNVRYFVEDLVQHRSRIRLMAIEAAGAKAEELADGFDADVGPVLSVAEGGATTHASGVGNFDNAYARVQASDDAEAPPAPGAIPLRVTLRVTYELEV